MQALDGLVEYVVIKQNLHTSNPSTASHDEVLEFSILRDSARKFPKTKKNQEHFLNFTKNRKNLMLAASKLLTCKFMTVHRLQI